MTVPSTHEAWAVRLQVKSVAVHSFQPRWKAVICTPKVSSVISQPNRKRCQRLSGASGSAMAADMSRWRRLTTKTATMTDMAPTPAPHNPAQTNCPEPAKWNTDMPTTRAGGMLLLTASTPKANATGT